MNITIAPGRDKILDWRLPSAMPPLVELSQLDIFVNEWSPDQPTKITDLVRAEKALPLSSSEEQAAIIVQVRPEGFDLTRPFDPLRPLVARVEGREGYNPTLVLDFLRHILRWEQIRQYYDRREPAIASPTSSVGTSALSPEPLEIFQVDSNGELTLQPWDDQQLILPYEPSGRKEGSWGGRIKMRLTNTDANAQYFSVLYLSQNFEIITGLQANDQARLEPGEFIWLMDNNPLDLILEDQTIRFMWPESINFFLVLAAPEPFDNSIFRQEGLPVPGQQESTRKASYFVRTRRPELPPAGHFTVSRLYTFRQPNPLYEEPNLFELAGQLARAVNGRSETSGSFEPESFLSALDFISRKSKILDPERENEFILHISRLRTLFSKLLSELQSGPEKAGRQSLLEMVRVMEVMGERFGADRPYSRR